MNGESRQRPAESPEPSIATCALKAQEHGTKSVWRTPALIFRGTVGQVLQSGGGKLSIAGADPGEMRCEKPHSDRCS